MEPTVETLQAVPVPQVEAGQQQQQQQAVEAAPVALQANGKPAGAKGNAEDDKAAELLLGFGSADSEGGDSGGGSSSGRTPKAAASGDGEGGSRAPMSSGRGLRRSSRQSKQPSIKANEMLNAGSGLSDEEFEPAPAKRPPKAAATRAAAPAASAPTKSELTVLCERFQQQFGYLQPDGSPNLLMLNDVAEQLGVPRRRLYDVINVFESIEVMRRVGKLMYEWVGFDHLPGLMEQLAQEEEQGVPVEDRIRRAPTVAATDAGQEGGGAKGNSHSLWVLSRRLVRMLLKSTGPIALTAAAAVLVGPGGVSDPSQHRSQTQITVERRLYDIGSILCSVGLIERIYLKKRQPAFEWIYGWKPGQDHEPPKLPNNYGPAPSLPEGTIVPTRKRASKPGGTGSKRQKSAADAAAEAAAVAAAGTLPFAMPFTMPLTGMPAFGMAGPGAMSPASMMAAMGSMMPNMSPSADGKDASGMAGMPMFFPSFLPNMASLASAGTSPEGVAAGAVPVLPKVEGASGSGEGAASGENKSPSPGATGSAAQAGMAGMMMWPPMMGMPMVGMAGMQNHVLPVVAGPEGSTPEGAVGSAGKSNGTNPAAAAAAAAAQFTYPMMMPMMAMPVVAQQQQQQPDPEKEQQEEGEGEQGEAEVEADES